MLTSTTKDVRCPQFAVYAGVSQAELHHVLDNLRPEDVNEAAAWGHDRYSLREMAMVAGLKNAWAVYADSQPVFIFGLKLQFGKVYTLWGFGTPDAAKVFRPFTRWGKRRWLPLAFQTGQIERIEARVPMTSSSSWHWLLWFGAHIDARLQSYGLQGQDFVLLSLTRKQFETSQTTGHPS